MNKEERQKVEKIVKEYNKKSNQNLEFGYYCGYWSIVSHNPKFEAFGRSLFTYLRAAKLLDRIAYINYYPLGSFRIEEKLAIHFLN